MNTYDKTYYTTPLSRAELLSRFTPKAKVKLSRAEKIKNAVIARCNAVVMPQRVTA